MRDNRFALIVANSAYEKSSSFSDLEAARNDALYLRDVLQNIYIGQFKVELILDSKKKKIEKNIKKFLKERINDDFVLLYFSCHGYKKDHNSIYLAGVDSNANRPKDTMISMDFIRDQLFECKSNKKILILDCCLVGQTSFNDRRSSAVRNWFSNAFGDREDIAVLTACDLNEISKIEASRMDNKQGSTFTKILSKGLNHGHADVNDRGYVTVEDIHTHVLLTMRRNNISQNPKLYGKGLGFRISNNLKVPNDYTLRVNLSILKDKNKPITGKIKSQLEHTLANKFNSYNLRHVIISQNPNRLNSDSAEDQIYLIDELGKEAANYLHNIIGDRHGQKIAISCGRTLLSAFSNMMKKGAVELTIFPLTSRPSLEIRGIDSNSLTTLCLTKLSDLGSHNVRAYSLPNCCNLDGNVCNCGDESAKEILNMASDSDIFIFGIGNPVSKDANIHFYFEQAGFTHTDIYDMDIAGELMYHIYNSKGSILLLEDLSQRQKALIDTYYKKQYSLNVNHLSKIRDKARDLIAVAGGQEKHYAILGAIKTGLIRTLITDINTATWLFLYSPREHQDTGDKKPSFPFFHDFPDKPSSKIYPSEELKCEKCGTVLQSLGPICPSCGSANGVQSNKGVQYGSKPMC